QPGQIVVSDHTRTLTEGFFVFDDLGEFTVKGKAAPVRAAAVTRELLGRTRLEVSRERGLTPLAGRESELHRLLGAFRRASEGAGAVGCLVGEPGVGKSRLLYEFVRSLDPTAVLELETSCPSYGRSVPYHPVLAIVRALLRVDDSMSGDDVEERVATSLQALGIEDDEAD